MALSDIVSISISTTSTTPSLPGFGIPLIAAYHTVGSAAVQTFSSAAAMVTAGFSTTHPAYLAAVAMFSQNPTIPTVKIGKRTGTWTHTTKLTCQSHVSGTIFTVSINGVAYSYTVVGGDTTTTLVATHFAATMSGDSNATVTSSGADVIITAQSANVFLNISGFNSALTWFTDTTTDSNLTTDLGTMYTYDNTWYGLILADGMSKTQITDAAAWAETNTRLFAARSMDTNITDSGTSTDVASSLKNSAYKRTSLWYSEQGTENFLAAAIMANRFPYLPGNDTWAFKTLAGVTVDTVANIPTGKEAQLIAKNANYYLLLAGVNTTFWGKESSGDYIDVTRFVDWLQSEMQLEILTLLLNNAKVPFTDLGVDAVTSVINSVLQLGIVRGGLAASPAPVITAPKVANISSTDKNNRNLPNVTFTAQLAGAIHKVTIVGTLNV